MTIEQPTEPFRLKRPFQYVRVRLFRGEMFEYIKGLFEDERKDLLEALEDARQKHDDSEAASVLADLRHINAALRDIYDGEADLLGPDEG